MFGVANAFSQVSNLIQISECIKNKKAYVADCMAEIILQDLPRLGIRLRLYYIK